MTSIYVLEKEDIPFYIGKTRGKWRQNIHKRKYKDITYTEIDIVNDTEWKFWEQYWICQFKAWGFELENKNNGGGGPEQYTEEQKQKMRKPHKVGTGVKISKALKGIKRKPLSEETKHKISQVRTGKLQPNISKANKGRNILWADKIGDALRGKPKNYLSHYKPVFQYDLQNNLLNEYQSAQDAGRCLGRSGNQIADCAAGRQKTAYGYIWKYKQ